MYVEGEAAAATGAPTEGSNSERSGALNVFLPGGFEVMMPAIVDYFASQDEANEITE